MDQMSYCSDLCNIYHILSQKCRQTKAVSGVEKLTHSSEISCLINLVKILPACCVLSS